MMKKFLMVALFALMGATVLKAQNNGVKFIEDKSLSDVLAQAGKANKYAFVDVYATWCGPCKYMTSQVFPQAGATISTKHSSMRSTMPKRARV